MTTPLNSLTKILLLVFGLMLAGCGNTVRGYRLRKTHLRSSFGDPGFPRAVYFVRGPHHGFDGLTETDTLLAIFPTEESDHAILLRVSGLFGKKSAGRYPNIKASTSKTLKGWILKLTDKSELKSIRDLRQRKESEHLSDSNQQALLWRQWWKIVRQEKTKDIGVVVAPIFGSIHFKGDRRRYARITIKLTAQLDGRKETVNCELEWTALEAGWL